MRLISAVSGVQVPAPPPFSSADNPVIAERVLRTVRKHGLIARGGRVVVALSGGPDSVALVHILRELERRGELVVAGVAHLNHQLRGDAADKDERFCRAMAASLNLPVEVGGADVRALAREQRRSIEDAARVARYAFLQEAADRLDADAIAVGHSRDDQAETFLLRLIRGSGPRGLAGILPKAGRVVRPLLEISRAELRAYLAERGIEYCEDVTNAYLDVPRNRVRHELIPYLEREFSPGIVDVLAREAAIAREDEDRLQKEAIDLAAYIVLRDIHGATVDVEPLTSIHPSLAARVARIALAERAGGRFIGFDHVEAFLEFARNGSAGAALSLPGQQVVHRGNRLSLGPEPTRPSAEPVGNSFRFPLSIPGEVTLATQGWSISAQPIDGLPEGPRSQRGSDGRVTGGGRGDAVAVAASALSLPLSVRSRRPGDRFRPLGLGGAQKKLQDFLVDRKVARETRDALPLVVDGADRIVWVVGQSVGEDFRVTEASQGVILLKARRLGGEG
jgi:tRNA(Ile)-lysidine synthase